MTYYKQQKEGVESQVDWSAIGGKIVNTLKESVDNQAKKEEVLSSNLQAFNKIINNPPLGRNKSARELLLDFSDEGSKYMLNLTNSTKSGLIKPKEYIVNRQNLLDGTDLALTAAKAYQSSYAETMDRHKTNASQKLEIWVRGEAEKALNLNKYKLRINPNGTVSMTKRGKINEIGQEIYDSNEDSTKDIPIMTVMGQITGKYNKFDSDVFVDSFVKGVGENIKVVEETAANFKHGGKIKSVNDITIRPGFKAAENDAINAALINPYNRLSVLTENIGIAPNNKPYDFTYDPNEAKNNIDKILLKTDPVSGESSPEFSSAQSEAAQNYLRNKIRSKYKYKEEVKITPLIVPRPTKKEEDGPSYLDNNPKNNGNNYYKYIDNLIVNKDLSKKSGKEIKKTLAADLNNLGVQIDYEFFNNNNITLTKGEDKGVFNITNPNFQKTMSDWLKLHPLDKVKGAIFRDSGIFDGAKNDNKKGELD